MPWQAGQVVIFFVRQVHGRAGNDPHGGGAPDILVGAGGRYRAQRRRRDQEADFAKVLGFTSTNARGPDRETDSAVIKKDFEGVYRVVAGEGWARRGLTAAGVTFH